MQDCSLGFMFLNLGIKVQGLGKGPMIEHVLLKIHKA